ncbi:MAG: FAD-dependent dehydrogenase [Vicingaceae bacterium]|nr:MAG: FAD-dependent dehydrogenase [Vicingaceae bacterium]
MIKTLELKISPNHIEDQDYIIKKIAESVGFSPNSIFGYRILKKSIDARKKPVYYLKLDAYINEPLPAKNEYDPGFKKVNPQKVVHIIGFGPAGMFAALECLIHGIKPVVFERGKPVRERRRDLALITRQGIVNRDSNYCFGEGGAGTFSDGKLYTRSDKRGDVRKILELLHYHGADEQILYDSHPHIGTNRLPKIVENIRNTILAYGGEINFNSKLTDIITHNSRIKSIIINNTREIPVNHLILATGHSARDIFHLIYKKGIHIEFKPFAMGVRIETMQEAIDKMQYHCATRPDNLPPASFSVKYKHTGKTVYSFCMCPGGIIAPCATEPGEIVTNGWSPSGRNNRFANSGLVTSISKEDLLKDHPLAGLDFQSLIEKKCFEAAGNDTIGKRGQIAPAQKALDFIKKRTSVELPPCSYIPGVMPVNLHDVLPDLITEPLHQALLHFQKTMPGLVNDHTILVAVESRTSSPVRIPRDKITFEHLQIKGLYPCGEGAGYAGGIVSAAIDGINCVNAISLKIVGTSQSK